MLYATETQLYSLHTLVKSGVNTGPCSVTLKPSSIHNIQTFCTMFFNVIDLDIYLL